jgi:transcriptional regulator with XRE-family HTH domain
MAEHADFAAWLRDRAIAAGYDLSSPRAGGRSKLATDTGISLSQIARVLSGNNRPDIDTQRRLAKALRVPLREMLIRSGTVAEEDLPAPGEASLPATPLTDIDLAEKARSWGIPEDKIHLFVAAIESVASAMADPDARRDGKKPSGD